MDKAISTRLDASWEHLVRGLEIEEAYINGVAIDGVLHRGAENVIKLVDGSEIVITYKWASTKDK